jgi:hypothetical protein
MKFEKSTFARAGEARMLAVEGEREIARAVIAFFARLFTRKQAVSAKTEHDALTKLVLH